jgi:hypothetical protein
MFSVLPLTLTMFWAMAVENLPHLLTAPPK